MHNIPDFLRIPSEMQQHFKKGGMIKRADGSYSRRGLWDNIRANRGSGRKPTKEMLEQEAKIRAQEQYGGKVEEYSNGGYTVKRSNDRKGKTHVVIGPDGTKKYFGDAKLGQHPRDPERKKAFYARHKHNLDNNPYFRAFARATWEEGGEVPHFDNGGNYGAFYGRRDAAKMQNMFTPSADSMSPSFAMGGLNQYQDGDTVVIDPYRTPTRTFSPPASNYPMYEMDMRGTENRWADRQPLEGMQTPPVIPANPTAPTTVAEDRSNLSQEIKQNADAFNRPDVERMERVPVSIRNSEKNNTDEIPTSLMKKDVVKTSGPLKTNDIPKTVEKYFDTYYTPHARDEYSDRQLNKNLNKNYFIFDKDSKKVYVKKFDPAYKGGFRIDSYPVSDNLLDKIHSKGAFSSYAYGFNLSDTFHRDAALDCKDLGCLQNTNLVFNNDGLLDVGARGSFNKEKTFNPYGAHSNKDGGSENYGDQEILVLESNKSFEDNEKSRKENAIKGVAYGKLKQLANEELEKKLKVDKNIDEYTEEFNLLKNPELKKQAEEYAKEVFDKYDDFVNTNNENELLDFIGPPQYINGEDPYGKLITQNTGSNFYNYTTNYENVVTPEELKKIEELREGLSYTNDADLINPAAGKYSNEYTKTRYYYTPEEMQFMASIVKKLGLDADYYTEENKKKLYDYEQARAQEEERMRRNAQQQRKFGGKIYKRGGSIRRFDVGGDNPLENLMNSNNQFESNYSPYSVNPWATGQPQQSVAGNPFDNLLNTQNQAVVTGSPYNTTIPQTANSGQGINTTTPQQSPTITTAGTGPANSGQYSMIATNTNQPVSTPAQSSTIMDDKNALSTGLKQNAGAFNFSNNPFIMGAINNAQNITNDMNQANNQLTIDNGAQGPAKNTMVTPAATSTNTGSTGEQIASRNQEYEDRMMQQYGITRKAIDARYEELSNKYKNSNPSDIYSAINKEFADQAKANETDKAAKATLARRKSIAGTLHGVDQMGQAAFAGLDLLSRRSPNSLDSANYRKNQENANPTNTMNIVGNRKGIEYSAHGGYTGLKEGAELNLTTQQIYELEKQGYKFQIL
jgi:hypothetical protein